jgi:hypothetical protein
MIEFFRGFLACSHSSFSNNRKHRLHFYVAYGAGIHSELPFPELMTVKDVSDDITILLRDISNSENLATQNATCFLGKTANVGMFLVRGGKEIIIDPTPGVDIDLLRTIVLGPIWAVLLRQRELAVFHASSININNSAIAFLGGSGWGKSTLARAFYDRGYGIVTDDVLAVRTEESPPQVFPAYPSVKLFPETVNFLGREAGITSPVHSRTEKHPHRVALNFSQGPLPLRRIYILAADACNHIEPLPSQEAFVELVRNSRAVSLLRDQDSRNGHLRQCADIVTKVPICRLKRRFVLSDLPEVVQLIEEDCTKIIRPL